MYNPAGVTTSPDYPVPEQMKAWILGDPDQLHLREKPVPVPNRAEVLVRIDAVAICATDLEIIHSGSPAKILGGLPFNKDFTPGHEYMGTVVALGPGVDEFAIGERISVEIHAGCGQCKRCRQGDARSCTTRIPRPPPPAMTRVIFSSHATPIRWRWPPLKACGKRFM